MNAPNNMFPKADWRHYASITGDNQIVVHALPGGFPPLGTPADVLTAMAEHAKKHEVLGSSATWPQVPQPPRPEPQYEHVPI